MATANISRDFPVTAPNLALAWSIPAASLLFAAGSAWWAWSRHPVATTMAFWPRSGPLVATIVLVLAAAITFACIHRRRVVVDGSALHIVAGITGTKVEIDRLDIANAKVIDLDTSADIRIGVKLFGVEMPGLKAGRFHLKGGGTAFVLLTDRHRVLALPDLDGRLLLLSMERPQQLLDALNQVATRTPHR